MIIDPQVHENVNTFISLQRSPKSDGDAPISQLKSYLLADQHEKNLVSGLSVLM